MIKSNKRKIVFSLLLAIALIFAGAVKLTKDTEKISEYSIERSKTVKENYDPSSSYEGGHYALEQTVEEKKGVLDTWYEYVSTVSYYTPQSGGDPVKGDRLETGVNFSVVNTETPVTINDISTNQYYAVGIVFNVENAVNFEQADRSTRYFSGDTFETSNLASQKIKFHNKYWYDEPVDGSNSKTRSPGGDLNKWEGANPNWDNWNDSEGAGNIGAPGGKAPPPTPSIKDPDKPGYYIDDDGDGFYGSDASRPWSIGAQPYPYSIALSAESDLIWAKYSATPKDIIRIQAETDRNVSSEEWHEIFDNDETTLFGASSYNSHSHFILKFPLKDWVDNDLLDITGDPDPEDNFGITPISNDFRDNVYRDDGTLKSYTLNGRAISRKDALSINSFSFLRSGYNEGTPGGYAASFSSGNDRYTADPEDGMEEIVLSYPTPEFSMETLGYNEKNEFEVLFKFDHTPTSLDYSIVNYIDYELKGPLTNEIDSEDITLDHIYLDDDGAHREIIAYLDPYDTTGAEIGEETFNNYELTAEELAVKFPEWTDNDPDNGGQVIDETTGATGTYPDGFELPDYDDGNPDSEYKGDMEIGYDNPITSTIKYKNLFYEDQSAFENGASNIEYNFNADMSITPTELGLNSAFLVDAGYDKRPEIISYTYPVQIKSTAAAPTIEKFELIDKDQTNFDTTESATFHVVGDSKTLDEDYGTGQQQTGPIKMQLAYTTLSYNTIDGTPIYPEEPIYTNVGSQVDVAVDGDGKFDITFELPPNTLSPNNDYTLSLFSTYGSTETGEPINKYLSIAEDGIDINVLDAGSLKINLTDTTVVWSDPDTIADPNAIFSDDGTATINFTSTFVDPNTEDSWGIESYANPSISKVEVVNTIGESSTVIKEIDISEVTNFEGPKAIVVNESELKPNKQYNLSVKVFADSGIFESPVGATFKTQSLGAFTPMVGELTTIDKNSVGTKVTSNFEFSFNHQLNDSVNNSDYIASGVTGIDFEMQDSKGTSIINRTIGPTELSDGNQEVKIYGTDTGLEGGTVIEFNPAAEGPYIYTITVHWKGEDVVKSGPISFSYKGNDQMFIDDVTLNADAGISSTSTSLWFSLDFADNEIAPHYDSYQVLNVAIKDNQGNLYDGTGNSTFQFKDSTGAIVESIPMRDQGVLMKFGMDIFISNIKPGTDINSWTLEVETDSNSDEGASFATNYSFRLGDIFGEVTPVNPDGSENVITNGTNVEILEGNYEIISTDLTTATTLVNISDPDGYFTNLETLVMTSSNGQEFSVANGNLFIIDKTTDTTRAEGFKTLELTFTDLNDGTTYDNFNITYELSEDVTNPINGEIVISTSIENITSNDFKFTTPKKPFHFPWWIIILLLITIGLILFALWWLKQPKVVNTTETANGTVTFSINRDGESGFDKLINGRTLNASQDKKNLSLEWTSTLGEVNEVLITLTGIKNTVPISKLIFVADQVANEQITAKYEKDLAKWNEAKEAAKEADKEFNEEKPKKPKLSKDIKVLGSVDTEIFKEYTGEVLKNEAQAQAAIKSTNRVIKNQKTIIKQANKTISSKTVVQTKKNKAQKAKDAAEVKLKEANKNLEQAKAFVKELKAKGTDKV